MAYGKIPKHKLTKEEIAQNERINEAIENNVNVVTGLASCDREDYSKLVYWLNRNINNEVTQIIKQQDKLFLLGMQPKKEKEQEEIRASISNSFEYLETLKTMVNNTIDKIRN